MKAIKEILNELEVNMENLEKDGYNFSFNKIKDTLKEIEELEAYITNCQGLDNIKRRTVASLAVLQNENKSLVKTLEKYNEEIIELRKENKDLLNTIIEAQKVIKNVLECKK